MRKTHKPMVGKDGEVRPMHKGDKVRASMLKDSFPDLAAHAQKRKAGRPKSAASKKLQSFKLSPDVIEGIRNSGAGYNVRVEAVLREALSDGRI
jgi:uncharacterized protein (DUF4415 family)